MSKILPMISITEFVRKPNDVMEDNAPFTVIISHNEPKAVVIRPEIFAAIKDSLFWQEICEQWWEANDPDTRKTVAKGKKMMKTGNYAKAVKFE